jgi:hypothetical protein
VAAAIPLWASVRCRLLLRRWWRAVRGQRQWARKVIVFMAAARLRRLLHAWRQAAYQERQEGVKQAQATQSEGRMEQVRWCSKYVPLSASDTIWCARLL